MKKAMLFAMLLVLSTASFSQQTTPSQPLTREDYLKKSKNQKTAGWVLLGGGTVLIGTGFLIGDGKESSFDDAATGVIFGGIGLLAAIGSIPLFIAAGKNSRKAAASVSFKMENATITYHWAVSNRRYPAVAIRVHL